ncbi:MAG: hypothetical protein H6540_07650 [Bacteroidales bacterium]|nr:hypothetical protein [Bacteroidales bacterium]
MATIELSEELLQSSFQRNINHIEKSSLLSSKYLYHYTKTFSSLKSILENGFRPSVGDGEIQAYQFETYELKTLLDVFGFEREAPEVLQIPICCFCDIPPKLARVHRKNYGYYCIGLKKEWGVSKGLSPIIYMPLDTKLHSILKLIFSISRREQSSNDYNNMPVMNLFSEIEKLRILIKLYKNQDTNYKYYDEREWRYIPPQLHSVDYTVPENYLKFELNDIYQIYVRTKKEKHELLGMLTKRYGTFKSGKIKVKNIPKKFNKPSNTIETV